MLDDGPDRFELWLRTNAGQTWLAFWRAYPVHAKWRTR